MSNVSQATIEVLASHSTVRPTGNFLLDALPDGCARLLQPHLREVTLSHGNLCYGPGDPIDQVYFPHTGMISLLVATSVGEIIEISSVGREGAVGLQSGLGSRRSFTRAIVQIPGQFWLVAAGRLQHAVSGSVALRDLIHSYTEQSWAEAQQTAACNALHDASSRLCRWLLQTADRIGSEQFPLTQELLAEMVGVRRTTVTLLAQHLQNRGILRYSRGKITILDRPALQAAACECYGIVARGALASRPAMNGQVRNS